MSASSVVDVADAFDLALERMVVCGFDELGVVDKILVAIWGVEAEVNNGGFDQYYFNTAGDQAFFAPSALKAIGACAMAEIVSRANAVFGPDGPPSNGSIRRARLVALTSRVDDPWADADVQFQRYPDDVRALLKRFLDETGTQQP